MSLNLDDSGVFRVPKLETGAPTEVRVPQGPPPPVARQQPMDTAPPAPANVTPSSVDENPAPRVNAANAPREVRVPITPAPAPQGRPLGTAAPTIAPAVQKEHRVTLPCRDQTALRYDAKMTRVSVSARKLEFPSTCPCCNRAANMTYDAIVEKKRDRQESKRWTFPYCGTCLRHVRQARWQRFAARGASVLAAALFAGAGFLLNLLIPAVIVGVVVCAAGWFLGERLLFARLHDAIQPECACYGPAVKFREYFATEQHFEFANQRYADAFSALNERKLL